jgi:hypothetical protein
MTRKVSEISFCIVRLEASAKGIRSFTVAFSADEEVRLYAAFRFSSARIGSDIVTSNRLFASPESL